MTTEITIGPYHVRNNLFDPAMPETRRVPLHWHTVPHVFQVKKGSALVEILDSFDGNTILSRVVRGEDDLDLIEIEARKFHRVTLLEPDTRTQCWFAELVPTALLEQRGKDAEYDKLLDQLIAMASAKWRVVVKNENGRWIEGNH